MHARIALALALALALTSCNSGSGTAGCTVTLHASTNADPAMAAEEDRTNATMAFVDATDHSTICFAPGHYHFSGTITGANLTGLTVRGTGAVAGDVILDFAPQTSGERGLSLTNMTDLTVENMTVIDATHDDVYVQHGNGVTIQNVVAGWVTRTNPGAYAIYPVESTDVLLDHVEAYGSADSGIYVGQTTRCIVRNSVAHGNVAGIEIENSQHCEVYGNVAHDNTGGILVFELPGLALHGMGTSVHDNTVMNNNLANFADHSGIVSHLPVGTGMMVLAAHEIEIHHNTVSGNGTTGLLMISYSTAVVAGAAASMDPMYDGYLRHVWVHDNTMTGNSQMPDPTIAALAHFDGTEIDVAFDGVTPMDNMPPQFCLQSSGHYRNVDAANGFANPSDVIPAEAMSCMAPMLPAVTL